MTRIHAFATFGLLFGLVLAATPANALANPFTVSSDGTVASGTFPPGIYTFQVNGTYTYDTAASAGTRDADAACLTTDGTTWTTTQGGGHASNNLHLLMQKNSEGWTLPWGTTCSSSHTYSTAVTCLATCTISFYILDDIYGDNAGSLTVTWV
jgi:hypothetical protein